jgi:chemotaxis response regulator CheB
MKWTRLLLFATFAALGVWAWVALHPSPEEIIRKQLQGVARAVSFGPGEGYLAKLAGAERLADFFSTNVEVRLDVPGRQEHTLASREEIQQEALAARAAAGSLSVTFPDVAVVVDAGGASAVADLTLQAKVGGQPDLIVQEMKFTLRKINSQWLIVKVETLRTLS